MTLPELVRVFHGDQRFVGWADPGVVIRRARAWLTDGEPLATPIGAAAQILSYMVVLRNAVAHQSDTAQGHFILETRRLYGAVPPRATPGGLLLGNCPAAIPGLIGPNLFAAAVQTFRALANAIVP